MHSEIVALIPAYQCARSIGRVVEGCREHVARVFVVDDGSTDNTAESARSAGAEVARLEINGGKGTALRHGFNLALASTPKAVALLDGDGQHDPADLPRLIAAFEAEAGDLIIGSRMGDWGQIPRARFLTNFIGSRILSWMTGFDVPDSQSGYRLISATLLARLGLKADGYSIESEMLIKAARLGARVAHVPVATIYDGAPSHFQPVLDTTRICLRSVYYKVFDDG